MQCLSSCVLCISLSIMFARPIRVLAHVKMALLFVAERYFRICVHLVLFICSSVGGYSDCFHLLAVVNNATINMSIQISVCVSAFSSFGSIPMSEIAVPYSNCRFNLLTAWQNASHRGHATSHSHQQCILHILTDTCPFPFLWFSL